LLFNFKLGQKPTNQVVGTSEGFELKETIRKNSEDVRQGEGGRRMPLVLGLSVLLVLVAFGALFELTTIFAAHQ
jgi:hypothetical protein